MRRNIDVYDVNYFHHNHTPNLDHFNHHQADIDYLDDSTTQTTTTGPGHATGGVLKAIITGGPAMMSYRGQMGPADATYTFPAGEYLVEPYVDEQGNRGWIPFLCESYKIDHIAKTFTFNLRKGVKFTDGSEMTAAVVKWNFQQDIDNGWLQDADKITSIDTPDNYTVVINFTVYSNQYEFNWGWTTIFSTGGLGSQCR